MIRIIWHKRVMVEVAYRIIRDHLICVVMDAGKRELNDEIENIHSSEIINLIIIVLHSSQI